MHLYAFFKLRDAFRPRSYMTWLLISWMVVMTIIPLLVRVAEQLRMEKTALLIAWPGYLWMGFMLIFTSALLITDAIRLIYRLVIHQISKRSLDPISSRNVCRTVLLLAVVSSVYAILEAGQIRTEHVVIASSKLPSSISRIRIVQISDVHIGLLLQEGRLQRILEKIRKLNLIFSSQPVI